MHYMGFEHVAWAFLSAAVTMPTTFAASDTNPFIRNQQRQEQLREEMQPDADVLLPEPSFDSSRHALPQNETPCFAVQRITLSGEMPERFAFSLREALKESGFRPGMCLGSNGINHIMTLAQNAVIEKGYTTSRILAAPQNMKSGELVLTVIPGKIHTVRYDRTDAERTHIGRITAFGNQLSFRSGDVLNLRDIEQSLENLKRNPTADADVRIEPSHDSPNESDVVISWKQRTLPLRLALNVDDSGSKATGKYQGSITLAADNPLGMSDLFYVNYNRDLGHKTRMTDSTGADTNSGTHGYAVHYSVPFGNWLFSFNHNGYRYHQAVAGLNENYDYNGQSTQTDWRIDRLLHRSSHSKTHVTFGFWKRESDNYINDAHMDIQTRRMAGWKFGLSHKHYLGNATLNLDFNYKRGTGALGSMRSPEEVFDEGTSRMQVITLDVGLYAPFSIKKQQFVYDTNFHSQWNQTPLITQDKLSIGGRYTVRGFDGEVSLMGEHGWYWQNTLGWQYHPNHQVYVGADIGHVSGPSTEYQLGQTLAGAVVGVKGQVTAGGNLYYDFFAGKPLIKPQYFQTARTTVGFNLNYSF